MWGTTAYAVRFDSVRVVRIAYSRKIVTLTIGSSIKDQCDNETTRVVLKQPNATNQDITTAIVRTDNESTTHPQTYTALKFRSTKLAFNTNIHAPWQPRITETAVRLVFRNTGIKPNEKT